MRGIDRGSQNETLLTPVNRPCQCSCEETCCSFEENFPDITDPEKIPTITTTPRTDNQDPNQCHTRPPSTKAGIIETTPIPIFLKRSIQRLLKFLCEYRRGNQIYQSERMQNPSLSTYYRNKPSAGQELKDQILT